MDVLPHLGDYAAEISAGAAKLNIPLGTHSLFRILAPIRRVPLFSLSAGQAVLLNVIYEVEAGCTSIVAQQEDGTILHG